jgi:hypothetical protein
MVLVQCDAASLFFVAGPCHDVGREIVFPMVLIYLDLVIRAALADPFFKIAFRKWPPVYSRLPLLPRYEITYIECIFDDSGSLKICLFRFLNEKK